MSRKHPSFDQLIDYIESERKLKSANFSIYHNLFSKSSDQIKQEFQNNSQYLKFRKNGVYLYHEIISITRNRNISEDEQKRILQNIITEYLKARAKNNLAYAVLHEDKKDNLHFHIVISANEAQTEKRTRLSKSNFSEIQTRLEKWVLETYPQLEQTAVFHQNQTPEQQQAREAQRNQKAHLSNKATELKKRTGKTSERDHIKETLESLFENARDGQHFTELLEKENFKLYQRGKQFGIIDQRDQTNQEHTTTHNKYRFSTLGLTEAWEALDKKMTDNLKQRGNTTFDTKQTSQQKTEQQATTRNTQEQATMNPNPFEQVKDFVTGKKQEASDQTKQDSVNTKSAYTETANTTDSSFAQSELSPLEAEIQRRQEEMKVIREKKAQTEQEHQTNTGHRFSQ